MATLSKVEAIDQYFANDGMLIGKFVKGFISAHGRRKGAKMVNEGSVERASGQNSWINTNPVLKRHKSLQKILQKDNRRFREQNLQDMMQHQTFRPSMAPKSKKLAEQYNRRIQAERSKSREKQK